MKLSKGVEERTELQIAVSTGLPASIPPTLAPLSLSPSLALSLYLCLSLCVCLYIEETKTRHVCKDSYHLVSPSGGPGSRAASLHKQAEGRGA